MAKSGSLAGFAKLALVVVLLVLGYTEVLPRLRENRGGLGGRSGETSSGEGQGGACVAEAAAANRAFGSDIGRFARAGEVEAWEDHRWETESLLDEAEQTCDCNRPSCEKARDALAQLRTLVDELDSIVRSDTLVSFNPARRQERIDNLLGTARDLARRGQ